MTFPRTVRLISGLAVLAVPVVGSAQGVDDYEAYLALISTPAGALPPVMTSTIVTTLQRTTQFSVRYGYQNGLADPVTGRSSDVGANNFAATVVLPMGLGSTVSLSAGAWYPTEKDYSSHLMLSGAGDYRIGSAALSDAPASPLLALALSGELGFAKPRDATMWSANVGVPVSLVTQGTGMRIAPFVVPGLGFGTVNSSGETRSGMRFTAGGGVGLYNPASTLSVNLGFQHVFIRGSSTLVGVVLSLGSK
jgi:hypothetical protein